jgi:UDP-N-acetylmuramate dehydrogenase
VTSPDSIKIENDVSLGPLTTLKVGGPARFFVRASNEAQVVRAFAHADQHDLKVFVLGGGSNILVSDNGFDGLVVNVALKGVTISDETSVTAGAGEDWDRFVEMCVNRDLAGVESQSGIHG